MSGIRRKEFYANQITSINFHQILFAGEQRRRRHLLLMAATAA